MQTGRVRLRQWIDRSKINQRQAAELLEVDQTYLSQILSGKRSPGLATAVHFENVTGIAVEAWVAQEAGEQSEGDHGSVANAALSKE
jgi:transcriptional regulator with XRE-family HTH domain